MKSNVETGKIREMLDEAMEKVLSGDMSPSDGRNLVGLANQISLSLSTELKARKLAHDMGEKIAPVGKLKLN